MIGVVLKPMEAVEALQRLRAACLGSDAAARDVMSAWVEGLSATDVLRFDDRARFSSWVQANPLGDSDDWTLAVGRGDLLTSCVASVHADGFLRERAVRSLADLVGDLAARFLALRAVDHVEEVRRLALEALLARPIPADAVTVLEILLRLRGRAHGPGAFTAYVEKLEASAGYDFPRLLLSADDMLVRRFGYETAMTRGLIESGELPARVAGEIDQWSRRRLAEHWISLDPVTAKAHLLHGRYVEGRLIAVQYVPDELFGRSDLERRMLDRSARVREVSRWRYRRAGHEPAAFYRAQWEARDPDVEPVLAGLRETGQLLSEDEAYAAVSSDEPRTRLAALRLWPTAIPPRQLLLELLADPSRAVVKQVAKHLAAVPSTRYDDVAAAANSESPNQRRAACTVRRELGDWNRVRADLEAMRDTDRELAGSAERDLLVWLERHAATTYKPPLPSEREAEASYSPPSICAATPSSASRFTAA